MAVLTKQITSESSALEVFSSRNALYNKAAIYITLHISYLSPTTRIALALLGSHSVTLSVWTQPRAKLPSYPNSRNIILNRSYTYVVHASVSSVHCSTVAVNVTVGFYDDLATLNFTRLFPSNEHFLGYTKHYNEQRAELRPPPKKKLSKIGLNTTATCLPCLCLTVHENAHKCNISNK